MLKIISCNQCRKQENLTISFKFEYCLKSCKSCYHSKDFHWNYYFCNLECFLKWFRENQIEEQGFPCQQCRSTGFAYGFEENGICEICCGTKRIKEVKIS